ncbi:MAG: type II toxin-antitoxin system RelE/ParE family toxin [Candidatus Thiodubiliella endoseptemdiera]|uniref:Type II toxin-antitoxin system RelE/ParE family toxin n=1 Tax=Candidatus Thiodubiliella endoseptemdiera TaxID=2738886 RepID=A0A853F9N1_9GAMM|nr:type II toxin-antitoxin system RelE/ParE family toxin [Candidatus Thiodubiliella endoseptemdiera]
MIDYSATFLKEAKQLSKKYKSFKSDLRCAVEEIQNKELGTSLGKGLYKKRVKNSSNNAGKSGGFRVIIYHIKNSKIVLMSVYSKSQKDSVSSSELQSILGNL